MNPENNSNSSRIIAIVAVLLVGGGALIYSMMGKKSATVTQNPTSDVQHIASATTLPIEAPATTPTATVVASASTYKDGTYTATGSYLSPGGDEKMGVSVTLANDVITAASITPEPVSGEGRRYQSVFQQNFTPYVVGKKISDVNLTTISGSSLTPKGFNNALRQIKAQAKAS